MRRALLVAIRGPRYVFFREVDRVGDPTDLKAELTRKRVGRGAVKAGVAEGDAQKLMDTAMARLSALSDEGRFRAVLEACTPATDGAADASTAVERGLLLSARASTALGDDGDVEYVEMPTMHAYIVSYGDPRRNIMVCAFNQRGEYQWSSTLSGSAADKRELIRRLNRLGEE
jgi:hypothetical protein